MGQVMPTFMQERLNLTDAQKRKVEALQKEVDTRLDKILTGDQQKQLKALRESGPGGRGFGGPGGPDGFGPPPGEPFDAPRR
jgi:hypothetical protein